MSKHHRMPLGQHELRSVNVCRPVVFEKSSFLMAIRLDKTSCQSLIWMVPATTSSVRPPKDVFPPKLQISLSFVLKNNLSHVALDLIIFLGRFCFYFTSPDRFPLAGIKLASLRQTPQDVHVTIIRVHRSYNLPAGGTW